MNCRLRHIVRRHVGYLAVFFLLIALTLPVVAQTELTGTSENEYSRVTYLHVANSLDVDSVDVEDPGLFAVDDIVMLHNSKGWVFDPLLGENADWDSHVGQYAILVVDKIEGNTVIFNASTKFNNPYLNISISQRDHFSSQLIKVPRYSNARISGTLTAPAWDSISGKGGVLALFVQHELNLDGLIDMSGKGFKGADPGGDVYGGNCIDSVALSQRNYTETAVDSSGRKGESMLCTNYAPLRGYGRAITAGGGGNGKYSGGGGGSNYNGGGKGGRGTFDCLFHEEYRAEGGMGLSGTYYTNSNASNRANRIFFGGGGGCGTQDIGSGYTSTAGGNGGGIIVIIADTLVIGTSNRIYANGESVGNVASGAGGGGGGGGVIVLEINGVKGGELELYTRGGDGGDVNPTNMSEYNGPGGGGGGGVTWVSNGSDIITNIAGSLPGDYLGSASTTAEDLASGGPGPFAIDNLVAPLKGFLFNTISEDVTVCSDVIPPKIDGSLPKGGDGPGTYTYRWVQSADMINWTDADEVNTNEDYVFTAPLLSTTYFSRVVKSGAMIDSLNLVSTYTVVPAITSNLISSSDTICKGLAPKALNSVGSPGGATVGVDGEYIWQKRGIDELVWTDVDISDNVHSFNPSSLDTTTYYRREVLSSVCQSYSNTLEIKVLEPLGNLDILAIDTVCFGQVPGLLDGGTPTNGDQTKIWYMWEVSDSEFSGYSTIGDTEDFNEVAPLLSDKFYRRTVYSGRDSTCVSTPEVFKIEVLDVITGNDLVSAEDTICRGAINPISTSVALSGGDGDYSFTWEVNPDGAGWSSMSSINTDQAYEEAFNGISTEVRRVVVSGKAGLSAGDLGVCTNVSVLLNPVITIPRITNNTIITSDTAVCEGVVINRFRTDHPEGGKASSYAYQWQWADISGEFVDVPYLGAQDENFLSEPLAGSKEFRRIVQSTANRAICLDTSEVVRISITPKIENNIINLDDIEYLCYNDALLVSGANKSGTSPLLSGGDGAYVYKWEDMTLGGSWGYSGDGSGDQVDYSKSNYTDTRILRRIVSSDSDICIDTSLADTIVMRELPIVNSFALADPAVTEFCEMNDTVIFAIDIVNSNPAPFDFKYHDIEIDYTSEGVPGDLDSMNVGSPAARIEHLPQVDIKADYAYNLVSVTDNFGCAASLVPANTIIVTIYDTPVATVMMEDLVYQCGDSINLIADQISDSDLSYWTYQVESSNPVVPGIENANGPNALAILSARTSISADEVKFYWNKENGASGCGSIDSTTVFFSRRPDSLNFIEKDTVILFVSESGVINAISSVEGVGDWSIISGVGVQLEEVVDGPTEFQAEVSALALDDSHEFLFEFTNGSCGPYEDNVIIERKNAEQYQVFTPAPGSLGANDKLGLKGIEVAQVVDCYIYNSWGALVKKVVWNENTQQEVLASLGTIKDDFDRDVQVIWDGTGSDGDLVEDGIYYYKLMVKLSSDDEAIPIEGYVILKTR